MGGCFLKATESSDEGSEELELLLHASAASAARLQDGPAFIGWFQETVPVLAPKFIAQFEDDAAVRRSALHTLGRIRFGFTAAGHGR